MLAGLAVGPPGIESTLRPSIDGLFLLVGNLSAWTQWPEYQAKMRSFLEELKVELSTHGPESARIPGEQSWARENAAIAGGVAVNAELMDILRKNADRLSVVFPWDFPPAPNQHRSSTEQ